MKDSRRIVLYGNSVILGAIGASLRRLSQFEVNYAGPLLQEVQELDAVKPDILLFDLETTHTEPVFSLLENNPTLLLIGISPDINLVNVWSSRELRELSMQGLFEVIKSAIKDSPVQSGNDEDRPYRSVENK